MRVPSAPRRVAMPSADCLCCVNNIGKLRNPRGSPHEPLGSCQNCHSLACGHHGHRDPNVPEFICVECDPSLLAASAATITASTPDTEEALSLMRSGYRLHVLPPDRWLIRNIADLARRRPGYDLDFAAEISSVRQRVSWERVQSPLRNALRALDPEARNLIIAGLVIIYSLELPRSHIGEPFIGIQNSLV